MVPLAVGAFCPGLFAFMEGFETLCCGVASTAHCASLLCGALGLVMPVPLAVVAAQRLWVVSFGGECPPYAQIYFGRDGSQEGDENCRRVVTSFADLTNSLVGVLEVEYW